MKLVCSSSNFLPSKLLVLVSSPQCVSTMFRGLKLESILLNLLSEWIWFMYCIYIYSFSPGNHCLILLSWEEYKWRCFPFSSWKQWMWSAHWIGRQYTLVAEQIWPISNMEVLNHAGILWWGYILPSKTVIGNSPAPPSSSSPVSSDILKVEKQVLYTLSALLSLLE